MLFSEENLAPPVALQDAAGPLLSPIVSSDQAKCIGDWVLRPGNFDGRLRPVIPTFRCFRREAGCAVDHIEGYDGTQNNEPSVAPRAASTQAARVTPTPGKSATGRKVSSWRERPQQCFGFARTRRCSELKPPVAARWADCRKNRRFVAWMLRDAASASVGLRASTGRTVRPKPQHEG